MDNITGLLGVLGALSVATERVTEAAKKLPFVSQLLSKKQEEGSSSEDARKLIVQVLAVVIGTLLAWQVRGLLGDLLAVANGPNSDATFWTCLLFGVLASGGSGMWNGVLDVVREVKQHKEELRKQLAGGHAASGPTR